MSHEPKELLYGVEFDGQLHYDFEVRIPFVGDNIAALEEAEGGASNLQIEIRMLASAIVRLGSIPKESITYELLAAQLSGEDQDILIAAIADLKKKRKRPKDASDPSGSPSSPSESSASPNPASSA